MNEKMSLERMPCGSEKLPSHKTEQKCQFFGIPLEEVKRFLNLFVNEGTETQ